jgi:cystathionine gamma-synthase
MKFSTKCLHADNANSPDVASPLHVSTTFRFTPEYNMNCAINRGFIEGTTVEDRNSHLYSRDTTETRSRVEQVLGSLEDAYAVTYSSGLSAIYALLLHLQPRTIVISKEGYHGTHDALSLYKRGRLVDELPLETQTITSLSNLPPNTLIWLESPQNPRGEVADMLYYKRHIPKHVKLGVDATFAPPPIQNLMGYADFVMHSSTKYLGGHSDLLGGVLMTRDFETKEALTIDRTAMGAVMGSMEAWLLLRSLRLFNFDTGL